VYSAVLDEFGDTELDLTISFAVAEQHCRIFSKLSEAARPDTPASCFDSFLSFHQEAVQVVTDIEAIQAATSMAAAVASDEQPEDAPPVLQEIAQNRAVMRRRGIGGGGGGVSKSVSFAPGSLDSRQDDGGGKTGRSSSASRKCLAMDKIGGDGGDEKRSSSSSAPTSATTTAHSALGSSLNLAKQIQAEAASWFMEFLEAALETGFKKSKASATGDGRKQSSSCCPQSLMLRVINWVEMEQGGGRRPAHHRAATIARKLRIKAKNP